MNTRTVIIDRKQVAKLLRWGALAAMLLAEKLDPVSPGKAASGKRN